jgi:UDP-2-acetamido-2,6-beta-L-arabino-hexul-4-ose reductase
VIKINIDTVVETIIEWIIEPYRCRTASEDVKGAFSISLGSLKKKIERFAEVRNGAPLPNVGSGELHQLYSTFVSYLPINRFSYPLEENSDDRGSFVEMMRTERAGQISFFTAHPGVTRGGHYHHSKTEKFLVVNGRARFRFKNIITGEAHILETTGESPAIVETVPGWSHDITNVGEGEMLVLLWANEIFDPDKPDTVAHGL